MITKAVDFGEINSLREIFEEAKDLRRVRFPAHVLVVEDDPITRRVVVGALGEAHAIITAETARNAIAGYLLHAPDIVFLDIGLPDVDGISVLAQIMRIDPDAFVVMFSSHDDEKTINESLSIGAKGFITKPFKKEMLSNYIHGSEIYHHKSAH